MHSDNEKGFLYTIESVRSDFTKPNSLLIQFSILGEKVLEINNTEMTILIRVKAVDESKWNIRLGTELCYKLGLSLVNFPLFTVNEQL